MSIRRKGILFVVAILTLCRALLPGCAQAAAKPAAIRTAAQLREAIDLCWGSAEFCLEADLELDGPLYIYGGQEICLRGGAAGASLVRASGYAGPLVQVSPGGSLRLEGLCLEGGGQEAAEGAEALVVLQEGSELVLGQGTALQNNRRTLGGAAPSLGGGVYGESATVRLEGGVVRGCAADQGGGVYLAGASRLSLREGGLQGNQAEQGGGAYMASYGAAAEVELLGGELTDNRARREGGALFADGQYGDSVRLALGGGIRVEGNEAAEEAGNLRLEGLRLPVELRGPLTGKVCLELPERGWPETLAQGAEGYAADAQDARALAVDGGGYVLRIGERGLEAEELPELRLSGVELEGEARVGEELRARCTLREGAGEARLCYAWQKEEAGSFEDIPGANGESHRVEQEETGLRLRLRVWEEGREAEALCSEATEAVKAAKLEGQVWIEGKAEVQGKLSAGIQGLEERAKEGLELRWEAGASAEGPFAAVEGAEGESFAPGTEQVGKYLRLCVRAAGYEGELRSEAVGPVELRELEGYVEIVGEAEEGRWMEAKLSEGLEPEEVGYQWQSGEKAEGPFEDIEGANQAQYAPGTEQVGRYLRVLAVGQGNHGGCLESEAVGPVREAKEALRLELRGEGLLGETVTAVVQGQEDEKEQEEQEKQGKETSAQGGERRIHWERAKRPEGSFEAIAGAEGERYRLQAEDEGSYLRAWLEEEGERVYSQLLGPVRARELTGTLRVEGEARVGEGLTAALEGSGAGQYEIVWERREAGRTAYEQIRGALGERYVPSRSDLGATLRAKAVGVGDYRGEIEGEEIGPVEEGKEAKPALSRLEGPEDLRLEEALESAEETLRKLQAERGEIEAWIAGEAQARRLALRWRLEGTYDAMPGAENRFVWELAEGEAYSNPGGLELSGEAKVRNGREEARGYRVRLEEGMENGSLHLGLKEAEEGQWVLVEGQPAAGYALREAYWYDPEDREGSERVVEEGGFTMPGHEVVVGGRFEKLPEPIRKPIAGKLVEEEEEEREEDGEEGMYGRVLARKLNLRQGPGEAWEKRGTLPMGERVRVLLREGEWALVVTERGEWGYVSLEYLGWEESSRQVLCRELNLRKGPGTEEERTGSLTRGQWVSVEEESEGWARVRYFGGEAYVSAMYLG